ncbi:MAG: hypothetical protein ACLU9S_02560 [Oscillospiraceae bacterium]
MPVRKTACLWETGQKQVGGKLRAIYKVGPVGCCGSSLGSPGGGGILCLAGIPVSSFPNGIDTGVFFPRPQDASQLRQSLSIAPGERVILFAAPAFTHAAAGLTQLLTLASLLRNICLSSGAFSPPELTTHAIPYPTSTHALGHIPGREQMAVLYSAADVFWSQCKWWQDNFPPPAREASCQPAAHPCGGLLRGRRTGGHPPRSGGCSPPRGM